VAFVHGTTPEEADPWIDRAGLADIPRVSDPDLAHYKAFGLPTTGMAELFDPTVWVRGSVCAMQHGFGLQPGHLVRQLPGVFVVHCARILAEFRHRSPADRPDYLQLIREAASVTIR
jgi:hypothetical protein